MFSDSETVSHTKRQVFDDMLLLLHDFILSDIQTFYTQKSAVHFSGARVAFFTRYMISVPRLEIVSIVEH